jgi:hypothetical protein
VQEPAQILLGVLNLSDCQKGVDGREETDPDEDDQDDGGGEQRGSQERAQLRLTALCV